jgi:hypothetical protein
MGRTRLDPNSSLTPLAEPRVRRLVPLNGVTNGRMRRLTHTLVSLWMTSALAACGGSQPEAKEPAPADEHPRKEAAPPEHEGATDSTGKKAGAKDGTEPASGSSSSAPEQKSLRSAKDVLTGEGVFFEFSFNASEVHQAAQKKCDEKAGDDPKKKAECMAKASKQYDADGIAFRPDEEGKIFWLTIRRSGPKMVPVHKIQVEFADEAEKSITLKPVGRDQGTQPMGRIPDKVSVEVPTESEIVVNDAKLGKLVYTAKLGLFGKGDR